MIDTEVWKLLGQGGLAGIIVYIAWRIGERMISAIDRLGGKVDAFGGKVDEHARADVGSHGDLREGIVEAIGDLRNGTVQAVGELRQDIAVLDGRMQQFRDDWADQLTPVRRARMEHAHDSEPPPLPDVPRTATPQRPISHQPDEERRPTGEYSYRRPPTGSEPRRRRQ